LEAAWKIVQHWTAEQRQKLRDDVPKLGFGASIAGQQVLHLAKTTLDLADRGLARRKHLDQSGQDERRHLAPVREYISRGVTPAQELLEKYHGAWNGRVEPLFEEYAY